MSSDPNAKRSGQDFWLDQLEAMGGQFWPPSKDEEEEMPTVGARFPMMLYNGGLECVVLDEEDYNEAKKNGFSEHPSLLKAQEDEKKRKEDEAKAIEAAKPKEVTAEKKSAVTPKKEGEQNA